MLDKNGFKRLTYLDLLEEMQNKSRELFGENVNVSPRSPLGIILILFAFFLAAVWMLAEKVYYAAYVGHAEGVQLDYIGSNHGIPRELATESYVDLLITGTPGLEIPELKQYKTETDVYFLLTENVTLDGTGSGTGRAVSIETGLHTIVPVGSITIEAEPMEGLTSVTNPEVSTGGRGRETDGEYRPRLSAWAGGKGTVPAILSALRGTSGVRSANVVINNKNVADASGNPPKSIHAYVLGGDSVIVAEALFDAVGAGLETVGTQMNNVTDISGIAHEVRFDYAVSVNIQMNITLTKNSSFPTDGATQVKDNLVGLIGGEDSNGTYQTGYAMGQDVIYSQLFSRIYQIPGIEDVVLSVGKQGDVLGSGNVAINSNEVATSSATLIGVT